MTIGPDVSTVGVFVPIGDVVTADPDWMASFAGHLERCGFELRVGVGWLKEEIEACGVDFGSRGRGADEQIAVMRAEAAAAGRDPAALEVSLGHLVTKINAERAGALVDEGADRIVLAMPPTTDIGQARDILSACAQRLALIS